MNIAWIYFFIYNRENYYDMKYCLFIDFLGATLHMIISLEFGYVDNVQLYS